MKPTYFTTFLAGVDPLVSFSDIQQDLMHNYKGIYKIDKPGDPRKGFIFVHFLDQRDQAEFMKFGRVPVLGRDLVAKPFLKGEQLKLYQQIEGQKRLFVKNVPSFWDDSDLFQAVSNYGPVSQAYIVYDPKTNKSR